MEKLAAKASIQIQKPVSEVFEAIINPENMSNYFIAASTGKLEQGKTVEWNFPEFPDKFPVTAKIVRKDDYIAFDWTDGEPDMLVEIFLEPQDDNSTVVKIIEHAKENNPEGIKWVIGQTEGWANFLACMKAYLDYGINLRKGAFDFMFK